MNSCASESELVAAPPAEQLRVDRDHPAVAPADRATPNTRTGSDPRSHGAILHLNAQRIIQLGILDCDRRHFGELDQDRPIVLREAMIRLSLCDTARIRCCVRHRPSAVRNDCRTFRIAPLPDNLRSTCLLQSATEPDSRKSRRMSSTASAALISTAASESPRNCFSSLLRSVISRRKATQSSCDEETIAAAIRTVTRLPSLTKESSPHRRGASLLALPENPHPRPCSGFSLIGISSRLYPTISQECVIRVRDVSSDPKRDCRPCSCRTNAGIALRFH